jgi:hypothetical protein
MDDQKALSIVSALANGVNPLSGEVFPADSPYQSPDIVRALFVAVRALETGSNAISTPLRTPQPPRNRPDLPSNVGKPWTQEEDQRLLAEFDRGRSPRELAKSHGRTLAGVEARLEKHGRLQPQQRVTSNRYGQNRTPPDGDSRATHAHGS